MTRIRYAVDSAEGYTSTFVVDTPTFREGNAREVVVDAARKVVAREFPPSSGPYMVWDVENDQHVATFTVDA